MVVYLDYAAATPLDPQVEKTMREYYSDSFFNPSADYELARKVKSQLNLARARIAYWLGANAGEIIFTAGGTEANNLAISGVMRAYPGSKILYSAIEHESVRLPANQFEAQEIPAERDGRINLNALETMIDDSVVLISLMQANNEIGTIQPLKDAAKIVAKIRAERKTRGVKLPLLMHSDACQAANYLDLHVDRLGVDLLTLNGGKIYGPKQSGALYVRSGIKLKPLIYGGGQEQGVRSGTENVASDIGLSIALDMAQSKREAESLRLVGLRNYFIDQLEKEVPKTTLNGSKRFRLPNNIHISIANKDNEVMLIKLDQAGIMAAAGSACSVSKEESSHVLKALGLSDNQARSSLRFSLGRNSSKKDIDRAIALLKTV